MGKDITLADIAVMPALVRMADLGRAADWQDLPRVARWYDNIRAHPAFAAQRALRAPARAGDVQLISLQR